METKTQTVDVPQPSLSADAAALKWKTGHPPNEVLVEVKDGRRVRRVRAIWGRDGLLPHWESEDGDTLWHPTAFNEWRRIND